MPLSQLESRLRYEFRNAELLRQALTHRSHSATHNERLEFLGDSVLNCAVAALLFQRFSKLDEGDLSRVRANLVKQQSLYEIAQALNISDGLRLGEGELRSGGFRRPSILADAFEAIIGAVFLDGGFEAAQGVIKRLYVPILDHIDPRTLGKDAKTLLQEYLQGHKIALPTYTVVATHGAAHNQQFEVECTVPKLDIKVSGSGASRRAAEQAAAKKALDEVMAVAPMLAAKPKRSKSARGAKHVEPEIVPGVKGVQEALDLRSPDRKERGAGRTAGGEAKGVEPKAADVKATVDAKSGDAKQGEPKVAESRVDDSRATEARASADAKAGAQTHAAVSPVVPAHADDSAARSPGTAPVAMIRAAHVEHGADKGEPRAAKPAEKPAPAADRLQEKSAEKAPDKGHEKPQDKSPDPAPEKTPDKTAEPLTEKPDAAARVCAGAADRPPRARDASSAAEPDLAAAPVRVADAGH
ncbi:ribonuclease III [Burkholderia thailandensis]|uniref:ribonuclease III n=1 Tax=Burkholderia thailandensis TaxID=57975 RepID=UPI0003EC86FD|nr:ribonuclease III [Burkholderia thailandensis]AHI65088.1 ribonuclease III [Burkholderia thailandensis H0587]AOJ50385.1 ribonuclease III [Burkholderia thailandensis]AVR25793.1 ribonuclease III [Burkholderia thailandensis]MCZ2893952.1 ribonuclease III [Burkholderia thailandensis]TGB34497.1 ribonuclease III [Burkholderia thailandensis]